ncbi:beta-porphyranase A-like [Haliotis asinina]|uniref:beta-porphyranase A-like n=1 Tax=Haliotis asinina TaxID=109174 RepID=UPI0035326269
MRAAFIVTCFFLCKPLVQCDETITIFPEFLKIGDSVKFVKGRWNGKNSLDHSLEDIARVKQIGATTGRWIKPDGSIFQKATENPHRKGYPSPAYFDSIKGPFTQRYMDNVRGYNFPEMVAATSGKIWPDWIEKSDHMGLFPNNIDAAAEFEYLTVNAMDKGANGTLPLFFEVINEPDGKWPSTNWSTFISYHEIAAKKIKSKYPQIKVGGPTYTGASRNFDSRGFKVWKKMADFMDMSLDHLDFFSFHSYFGLDVHGGAHQFQGSEAKLIGLLDLIESYAHKKKGRSIDVIISEYGMGSVSGMDVQKPSSFIDWGYIHQHNDQMFTFLQRRDALRKVVAFLLTFTDLKGQESINYSLFDRHRNIRDVAEAFKFWMNFGNGMMFLRVDSEFQNAERNIVPHILLDKSSGTVYILLHNHEQKPSHVKLNFDKGWFHPISGKSTCEYLNSQKKPILAQDQAVHVTNSMVTVPAEASCYFQFHTSHSFAHAPTVTQKTYYSTDMVVPIHNTIVDVKVNVPSIGNIDFARLRISVSRDIKATHGHPKTVMVNNHPLASFYSLQAGKSSDTLFETFEYKVSASIIRQQNDVKMTFVQTGGFVSTASLVVGRH